MEYQLPHDPDETRALLARAAREIPRLRRPDALLALVLRYESVLPPYERFRLHALVAARACALDTRVLDLVLGGVVTHHAAATNSRLGAANADWLAVRCIALMVPPTSWAEFHRSRELRGTLQLLIERQHLGAGSLAAQLLFREACAKPAAHGALAQQALSLYLHFPDVPAARLERLTTLWREHEWGSGLLQEYRARGSVRK
jgi:hypothetical protein